ncbi:hypothetical protein GCM10009846_10290 [Agrococcus versicolor]|uniref:Uncharacterized protein n=1 Tax=Agrococcus versicolor TaxID=501482 RepID=A0ABP5MI30_9MICO
MAHFYRYDTPGTVPVESSSLPSFDGFTHAAGDLITPDGDLLVLNTVLDAEGLSVYLPLLDLAGVFVLQVSLTGPGVSRAMPLVRIPVEERTAQWHTIDSARHDWDGAPQDDARLFDLLAVAREQCEAYAPVLPLGAPVPLRYRQAQLLQARNVWNASRTDPGASTMGADGFQVTVYPLDWTVQQMLRPRTRPVVA